MRRLIALRAVFAAMLMACVFQVQAVQSTVQAVNLPDNVPGQDLWRYDITLQGDLLAFEAVEYSFGYAAFGDFNVVGSVGPTFDVSKTDALPALQADGLLRFQAQQPISGGSFLFHVTFVSLAGTPGALPFTVYDADSNPTGVGVASVVPEPPAALLLACGLMLAPFAVRRARS